MLSFYLTTLVILRYCCYIILILNVIIIISFSNILINIIYGPTMWISSADTNINSHLCVLKIRLYPVDYIRCSVLLFYSSAVI